MLDRFINHLLSMIKSGISFEECLRMSLGEFQLKQPILIMLEELTYGHGYLYVIRHLFPWWCPYPFKNIGIQIDIVSFLSAYMEYYYRKKNIFLDMRKRLTYPLILVFFSMIILYVSYFIILPMFYAMNSNQSVFFNLFSLKIFFFLILFLILLSLFIIISIIIRLIRFDVLDMIEILSLSTVQEWPLDVLFTQLRFPFQFQKKWINIYNDFILRGQFSVSFGLYFKVPKLFLTHLELFENRGELYQGICFIRSLYSEYYCQKMIRYVYLVQIILYIVVLVSILFIFFVMYTPLLSFNSFNR